jgi:hypothetical protein
MPGIPDVYMEAGFKGHKAIPGKYTIRLTLGGETVTAIGEIVSTPGWEINPGTYQEYDTFMGDMESKLTEMHTMVNTLYDAQLQLRSLVDDLEEGPVRKEGEELIAALKAWDTDMIQRKSKAYDDVENFPNKFTAEYLFLINQSNSTIPRINQGSRNRKAELDTQWISLKQKGEAFRQTAIPAYNTRLWESGIGAIHVK